MFHGDLRFVDEYAGEVDSPLLGAELAEQIGDAPVTILASHGVVVTGETIELALYRAASIDRACRLAYDVLVTGRQARPISPGALTGMRASLLERAADVYYAGAVRLLLRDEPDVLS
jgi:ribulose-5-phosphate 4-epimerase/fuculose-1-phosphate aldolase